MTFEQPASLNRFIIPPISFTWGYRWNLFKLFLPVLIVSLVPIVEGLLFQEWIRGLWDLRPLLILVVIPIMLLAGTELQFRLLQKRRRILKLGDNYVQIGSGLAHRIPWRRIVTWQFYTIPDEKNYQIATMEYKLGGTNQKRFRRHTIVLEAPQIGPLISELKLRQQKDGLAFSISDQKSVWPVKSAELKRGRPAILYLYLAGLFLLIQGVPMLLIAQNIISHSPAPNVAPHLNGNLAKFAAEHFSSMAEFTHFLLVTGAILCGSGAVLMIWGIILDKKQKALLKSGI
jgi:hypothetical protein